MHRYQKRGHASICPEGAAAIGITAFSALLFAVLQWWPATLFFWVLLLFSLHFFRDPERVAPEGKDVAASPADGRIISIETRPDPFSGEPRCRVSIFMNVFSVHVNRAPVDCVVKSIKYYSGKFFNASFDKASEENERCSWLLEQTDGTKWSMTQIAGLIARRIVCRAAVGDHLRIGERLGMIRFGSRVDLYLPAGYIAAVEIGNKVYAGETVIAIKK